LQEPEIELISIKDPEQNNTRKAFFLFGEHAREMISPETGLLFLKQLCGGKTKILEKFEIQVILNANPLSRERVEKGEYCLRVNENGKKL
jgi:Zinc carboxypeptidase